jgi:hypothetical protein
LVLTGAALAALATALPAASPAMAQAQPQPPAAGAPPAARPLPPSRIEGRLAFLRTELKITDAQSKDWETVAQLMRQQDKARRDRFEQMRARMPQPGAQPPAPPSAIDQLQRRQAAAERRAADLKQFVAAVQPLYASFSDEQKRTADQLLVRGGGPGRHGMRGHHGRF